MSKDCIRVIEETCVDACVLNSEKVAYIMWYGSPTQNILVLYDFNMCFTFIMIGRKGSAQDNQTYKFYICNQGYNFLILPLDLYIQK